MLLIGWTRETYDLIVGIINVSNLIMIFLLLIELMLFRQVQERLSNRTKWVLRVAFVFLSLFAANRIMYIATDDFFYRSNIAFFYGIMWVVGLIGIHLMRRELVASIKREKQAKEDFEQAQNHVHRIAIRAETALKNEEVVRQNMKQMATGESNGLAV